MVKDAVASSAARYPCSCVDTSCSHIFLVAASGPNVSEVPLASYVPWYVLQPPDPETVPASNCAVTFVPAIVDETACVSGVAIVVSVQAVPSSGSASVGACGVKVSAAVPPVRTSPVWLPVTW